MAVGLVIVSHSARLAEGVVELAGQMAQADVKLVAAGGTDDGGLGTSLTKVLNALLAADSSDGVVVLVDLGSAGLIAEMALEQLPDGRRERIRIANAPLVEGAVVAAVQASVGSTLDEVVATAEEAATLDKLAGRKCRGNLEQTFTLINKVGLHARPASLLVQTAASVHLTLQANGQTADAKRILQVLQLGAENGAEVAVRAEGDDAAAVAAIAELFSSVSTIRSRCDVARGRGRPGRLDERIPGEPSALPALSAVSGVAGVAVGAALVIAMPRFTEEPSVTSGSDRSDRRAGTGARGTVAAADRDLRAFAGRVGAISGTRRGTSSPRRR